MVLVFVGLGLEPGGISIRGMEELKRANTVYAELYTSLIPDLSIPELERVSGKRIEIVNRRILEETPDEIIQRASSGRVVLLVPGDPMVATTHVDLRLRAHRAGVDTAVVHAASIVSAVAGAVGLQSYKFGPSATVPFSDNPSPRPYQVLSENKGRGLHTLLLLDCREEENRAMTVAEAVEILLDLEKIHRKGSFTQDTLAVGVARAGNPSATVKADRAEALSSVEFGPPPHCLVVPGKLHFMEAEALKVFARAPRRLADELVG